MSAIKYKQNYAEEKERYVVVQEEQFIRKEKEVEKGMNVLKTRYIFTTVIRCIEKDKRVIRIQLFRNISN